MPNFRQVVLYFNWCNIFLWRTFFEFLIFTAYYAFIFFLLIILIVNLCLSGRSSTICSWGVCNYLKSIMRCTTWGVTAFNTCFNIYLDIFILASCYCCLTLKGFDKQFGISIFFNSWWFMLAMWTCSCDNRRPYFFLQI